MATYTFDDENADFILRATGSRPQIDFRVHRAIIAVASPPLAAMLALPQPPSDTSTSTTAKPAPAVEKTTPTVEVSESASTLSILLQLIYPIPDPPTPETFPAIDDFISVLEAAYKYDIDGAISRLKTILISQKWLESSPLRVYAVAMRWDMEEEAKIASKYTLCKDLFGYPLLADFRHTSGLAFQRLALLHRSRSIAARTLIENATMPFTSCSSCRSNTSEVQWFIEWKAKAVEEVEVRPTTQLVFSLQFLGQIWALPPNPQNICSTANCERNKTWSAPVGVFFEKLKGKIDALASTI